MAGVTEAFYEQLDDGGFRATEHTVGPWDEGLQHGGPPSALLARAIERISPDPDSMFSRVCIEFLGPVPVSDLTVTARVVRPGRSVQLVEATLTAHGRDAMRATAWQLKRNASAEVGTRLTQPPLLPDPQDNPPPPEWICGFVSAMEWRTTSGGIGMPGPGTSWMRQLVPLLAGEEPTGLQRALTVADSGNGLSWEVDIRTHIYMNTDLTVHLFREPVGEWICLDAQTAAAPGAAGLATSVLSDLNGPVGVGAQSLFIAER